MVDGDEHEIPSAEVRLEARAIMERLTAPDRSTFFFEDAAHRSALIPVSRKSLFSLTGRFKGPGARLEGHVPDIGRAAFHESGEEQHSSLNADVSYLIGVYRVSHAPGQIDVQLMWAETRIDRTGHSCLLRHTRATKIPRQMLTAQRHALTIFAVTFAYVSYVPWKVPEASFFSSRNCS